MPPRKQPASLLAICHATVASNLVSTCRMLQVAAQESPAAQILALTKRRLRPRYLQTIPGSIRAQLLERASKLLSAPAPDGSPAAGSGPAPLYLLALLLAPDVKQLRVELCCYYGCSHQAALLRLLATEGSGLHTLELARSNLLRLDRALLRSALMSATNLRKLVLRNIAGDAILQVIGECCPVLEELDIAQSRQVTDTGLRGLLVHVELKDKQQEGASGGDLSQNTNLPTWSKLRILHKLMPWFKGEHRSHSDEYSVLSGKKGDSQRVLLQYCENSTELCNTLVSLDLTNTGVTTSGILLALHHAHKLETFGDFAHTGRALEIFERAKCSQAANLPPIRLYTEEDEQPCNSPPGSPTRFNLNTVRSCRTTSKRLELLGRYCPNLKSLILIEPRLTAPMVQYMPKKLQYLGFRTLDPNQEMIESLYTYLSTDGATLIEISMSFSNQHPTGPNNEILMPLIDLARIIKYCPKLESIAIDYAVIEWGQDGILPEKVQPKLTTLHLGRYVSANCITSMITWAPNILVIHIHTCPDMTSQHIHYISQRSQKLECFFVYEARHISSSSAVNCLLNSSPNMLRIGNIANWGLDCDGTRAVHSVIRANNLELELHTGGHWFCSPCVRGFS